jgi:hypothetical protein
MIQERWLALSTYEPARIVAIAGSEAPFEKQERPMWNFGRSTEPQQVRLSAADTAGEQFEIQQALPVARQVERVLAV